ncbi:MAG: hypothetical protein IPJ27_15260 [Candidatus Accumulibacter sp.]|uniref:Uncharacterized protein n=1 Tax=Candidatus Accumulibacter proximus TaxID=2954385 RepID=A0A935Q0T6_9PROT|nr:hypothetical protein [Candidatus Accumulibacter proximus]
MTDHVVTVTKPGRPLKGERPMTDRERKRAQRMRDKRTAIDAIGEETDAPLRALLDLLGRVEASGAGSPLCPSGMACFRPEVRLRDGHAMAQPDGKRRSQHAPDV